MHRKGMTPTIFLTIIRGWGKRGSLLFFILPCHFVFKNISNFCNESKKKKDNTMHSRKNDILCLKADDSVFQVLPPLLLYSSTLCMFS